MYGARVFASDFTEAGRDKNMYPSCAKKTWEYCEAVILSVT